VKVVAITMTFPGIVSIVKKWEIAKNREVKKIAQKGER
jgi:hypothetical protein